MRYATTQKCTDQTGSVDARSIWLGLADDWILVTIMNPIASLFSLIVLCFNLDTKLLTIAARHTRDFFVDLRAVATWSVWSPTSEEPSRRNVSVHAIVLHFVGCASYERASMSSVIAC